MFAKYDFEIKYRIDKTNFANEPSRRSDYEGDENENTCLFIFQNKLKNVAIAALCITSVATRSFVAKKAILENAENVPFKIREVIDADEKKLSKNEEKKVVFDSNAQQLRRSEVRAICKNENQYEVSSKILKLKLMKMQKKDLMIQRVRVQLNSKNQRKVCAKRNWRI